MPQSSHYQRGRINDPGLVYNVKRGLGGPPPLQDRGGPRPQPAPHRGRSAGSRTRSTSDNNRIMSRSATSHYATPTMASRSRDQVSRSLTRSHEEAMPPRSPSKNGLLRQPPNSPSRNALAASITSISQQVKKIPYIHSGGIEIRKDRGV